MTINSVPESYGHATGMLAPIPLAPGPVHPGGTSPVDAAMAGFGMATNADLGPVNGEIAADDADRRAHAADAAAKFPANEADAAQQFQGVGADGMAQMIPQMASGIGGALSGALGGVLGPLTQIPQQALQAGQGALQPLMGALQQSAGVRAWRPRTGPGWSTVLKANPVLAAAELVSSARAAEAVAVAPSRRAIWARRRCRRHRRPLLLPGRRPSPHQ